MKNLALKIALVAGVAVGGVASLAVADEVYSSIAVAEPLDENTSATIAYALGGNDLAETDKAALAECKRDGGARCYVAYRTAVPICVAIAEGIEEQNQTVKAWGVGDTNAIARSGAVKSCKDRGPIGAKCRVTTPHNQCATASNPSTEDLLLGRWKAISDGPAGIVMHNTLHVNRKDGGGQLSGYMYTSMDMPPELNADHCEDERAEQSVKIYVNGTDVEVHTKSLSVGCFHLTGKRIVLRLSPSGDKLKEISEDGVATQQDVTYHKQ